MAVVLAAIDLRSSLSRSPSNLRCPPPRALPFCSASAPHSRKRENQLQFERRTSDTSLMTFELECFMCMIEFEQDRTS